MHSKKTIMKKSCSGKGGPFTDAVKNVGGKVRDVITSGAAGARDTYRANLKYDKALMGGNDPISYASAAAKGVVGGAIGAAKRIKDMVGPRRDIMKNAIKKVATPAQPVKPRVSPSSVGFNANTMMTPVNRNTKGIKMGK